MDFVFSSTEASGRMTFRAKNYFSFTVGNYRVFTADSRFDVFRALQLRGQVFLKEQDQIDTDEFDLIADHILIEDVSKSRVIGTYRLISDIFSERFYSETQFDIQALLDKAGIKVELGRACIHPDYRNGRSVDLLWKGISTYLRLINGRYLFGCSSIFLQEPDADNAITYLSKEHTSGDIEISAHNPYPMKENILALQTPNVPSLLQSYLNAGAKLYGKPYWDQNWNCVDFLTILDVDNVSEKYKRHYFSKSLSYVENF